MESSTPISTVVRKRRTYSAQFKAEIVSECRSPGASVASVGRTHGINDNIVHRWLREHDLRQTGADQQTSSSTSFIALPLSTVSSTPPVTSDIQVQLQRGDLHVSVRWPLSASAECAAWVRALLR